MRRRPGGALVGELDGHEGVAELAAQEVEPLAGRELVPLEAQAEHFEAFGLAPALHDGEVGGGAVDRRLVLRRQRERQRRLRQHRRQHAVVDGHRQGEPAREAHADGTDAGAPAAPVLVGGERPQPGRHRGRPPHRPVRELPAHARRHDRAQHPVALRAGLAEQVGHDRRAADVDDPLGELEDLRRDARDLGDHDHGRSRPLAEDRPGLAVRGEVGPLERRERRLRHRAPPLSTRARR